MLRLFVLVLLYEHQWLRHDIYLADTSFCSILDQWDETKGLTVVDIFLVQHGVALQKDAPV